MFVIVLVRLYYLEMSSQGTIEDANFNQVCKALDINHKPLIVPGPIQRH